MSVSISLANSCKSLQCGQVQRLWGRLYQQPIADIVDIELVREKFLWFIIFKVVMIK